jgi:hypothetical protein
MTKRAENISLNQALCNYINGGSEIFYKFLVFIGLGEGRGWDRGELEI